MLRPDCMLTGTGTTRQSWVGSSVGIRSGMRRAMRICRGTCATGSHSERIQPDCGLGL